MNVQELNETLNTILGIQTITESVNIEDDLRALLSEAVYSDYLDPLVSVIKEDVKEDIETATTLEDCSVDDIRMAIGRVLLRRLGISV